MMPDDSLPPKSVLPFRAPDVPLAVKDAVREVRFNLRRGARKFAASVEAVAQHPDFAAEGQPLALLADSLGFAMRTTAGVLRTVDRTAVQLLASDRPYRDTVVPLRSSAWYFGPASGSVSEDARAFTQDHFWRYKHWLSLRGWSHLFVHEQGFDTAAQHLIAGRVARPDDGQMGTDLHLQRVAEVILALHAASIFTPAHWSDEEQHAAPTDLAWHAALCTVLAGEIAPTLDVDFKQQTAAALALADEITTARPYCMAPESWSSDGVPELVRWLGFSLRHL